MFSFYTLEDRQNSSEVLPLFLCVKWLDSDGMCVWHIFNVFLNFVDRHRF